MEVEDMEKTAGRQTLQRTKENKKILVTAQIKLLFKEFGARTSVLADLECH